MLVKKGVSPFTGCGWSHREVWKIIQSRKCSSALVIESDSQLIPQQKDNLVEVFRKYEEFRWETPTIVLLGSVYDGKPTLIR